MLHGKKQKPVDEFNGDSIDAFRQKLALQGKSANTLRAYNSDLTVFLRAMELTSIPVEDLEEWASRWLVTQMDMGAAPKTVSRRVTSLKSWASTMAGVSILSEFKGPESAPNAPHPLPEGIAGIERMIAVARRPAHRALIALCGLQGCRVSEALTIERRHLNLSAMVLEIPGKGKKTRYIPLSEKSWVNMQEAVVDSMSREGPIITWHERFARKVVTALGMRAELQRRVASHDLRATFATAVWDATHDMRVVQSLLGHADMATTQIYVGVKFDKMRDAVSLI